MLTDNGMNNVMKENKTDKEFYSSEYLKSSSFENQNDQRKSRKIRLIDREIGSFRGNFAKIKTFFKNHSILDREMGSLRSNFIRIKIFFKNGLCYVKNFFTKEKASEIRSVFSYRKRLNEQNDIDKSISLNSEE